MMQNPFMRKPVLPIRPAFNADFLVNMPGGDAVDDANAPPTGGGKGGLSQESINGIIGGVTGVLNTTADTILGVLESNNRVRIAELNTEAAQALAQIQNQLGVGGQTEAQRQALLQQQESLGRFMSLLQNRPPAQPDNTMLYVALAAGAALLYMQMNKSPAPAPAPRRNPHRRTRRRSRR